MRFTLDAFFQVQRGTDLPAKGIADLIVAASGTSHKMPPAVYSYVGDHQRITC